MPNELLGPLFDDLRLHEGSEGSHDAKSEMAPDFFFLINFLYILLKYFLPFFFFKKKFNILYLYILLMSNFGI